MNATRPEVQEYLDELRRALADRPAEERELVVDGIRQHIDDAVAGGTPAPQVLEDLGDPLAIAAESGPAVPAPAPPFLERRAGAIVVVLVLVFGGFVVPVLGWVVGVVLLWLSRGWRTVDKVVGTAAPLAGLAVAFAWTWLFAGPAHLVLLSGSALGAVASAVYLLARFRPRD